MTLMLRRTSNALSETPRSTTLATSNSVPPSRGMLMTMYVSGLMSGRPSAAVAMCGDDAMMLIASRGIPLDSSLSAPRRSSSTLSADPVFTSAAMKPFASASMAMNTATTSPMPSAVSSVETGRCETLRTL